MLLFDWMVYESHLSFDELEAYSVGRANDAGLESTEEHLLICEHCQKALAMTDQYIMAVRNVAASLDVAARLRSVHITDDGPVFGAIHIGADGRWIARHWGRQLDGGRTCDSVEDANAYLMDSFHQMFPEHVCTEQCREDLV